MPDGHCKLCGKQASLQLSHILPAFIFRWLRDSAGGNPLRNSQSPNLRVQDGEKRHWLCRDCEGIFGKSEKAFADRLFYPYLTDPTKIYSYSGWLLRFCTSVSWRVLSLSLDADHVQKMSEPLLSQAKKGEAVWKAYLLGDRPNPGAFEQHLLPLGEVASTSGSLPSNFNRYVMRAVQMDLCHSDDTAFTFAKLGRFAILGFLHDKNPSRWRGARVSAKDGFVQPKRYVLPTAFGDYLAQKARDMSTALGSVSDKQAALIDRTLIANAEKFVGSDAYAAMEADIRLFGDAAFSDRGASEP